MNKSSINNECVVDVETREGVQKYIRLAINRSAETSPLSVKSLLEAEVKLIFEDRGAVLRRWPGNGIFLVSKHLLTLSLEGPDDSHYALSSDLDPEDCYLELVSLLRSEKCCRKVPLRSNLVC